ncbi:cytochrome C oxidase subunit IV family protein [Nocardioides montaniterrae]
MLRRLIADRQLVVWLVLVLATGLTATLGLEEHGSRAWVGVALIGIGVVKLRLVAMHFMEVRDAPPALRLVLEAYAGVLFCALAGIYLFA